jgi:hypothetical protein
MLIISRFTNPHTFRMDYSSDSSFKNRRRSSIVHFLAGRWSGAISEWTLPRVQSTDSIDQDQLWSSASSRSWSSSIEYKCSRNENGGIMAKSRNHAGGFPVEFAVMGGWYCSSGTTICSNASGATEAYRTSYHSGWGDAASSRIDWRWAFRREFSWRRTAAATSFAGPSRNIGITGDVWRGSNQTWCRRIMGSSSAVPAVPTAPGTHAMAWGMSRMWMLPYLIRT